jgi:DNA repair protein RadC
VLKAKALIIASKKPSKTPTKSPKKAVVVEEVKEIIIY